MASICRSHNDHDEFGFTSVSNFIGVSSYVHSLFFKKGRFSICHSSFSMENLSNTLTPNNQVLVHRAQNRHPPALPTQPQPSPWATISLSKMVEAIGIPRFDKQAHGDRYAGRLDDLVGAKSCAQPEATADRSESESASGARRPFRRAQP